MKKLAILLSITAGVMHAQSGNATVSGSVKDSSSAAVMNVKITVFNTESGGQAQTTTNEDGLYRVSALLPGTYKVEASVTGFDRQTRGPVTLQVNQTLALDLTLTVGRQTQTLEVVESAPLIESQSSHIAQTVTREMLAGLPLPNRAASSLAALAPGVVMIDSGSGTAENYPVFSVAGGRARNQSFILDGGNVSNAVGLTRPQQLTSLPVDAMQEFQVISSNYGAEYGHSTGGIVTMSTRAGTNHYHGTLFESLQNTAFNARNFFAASRAPIRLNQFGGTFGGPVRKDKTFFFATWEQTRQLTSDTIISTVPTLLDRTGAIVPPQRLDRVAFAALDYYPLPNRPGTLSNANNFVGSSANSLFRNILVGRLDHQFGPSDLATARYYINDSNTSNSGTYGIPVSDPNADLTAVRVQSMLLAETHIFSARLSHDLRLTYLRRKFIDTRPGAGDNLAARIGLTGVSPAAFPAFVIPGYATLGNPAAVQRIQTPILDRQVIDTVSWQQGRHAFKFGAEMRLGSNDEIRDRSSSGVFTFSPLIAGGNALAGFLQGQINSASIQVSDKIASRASYLAFFAQDDWRITDRLTINAGLRWEAEFPRKVQGNKQNSFDPLAINPVSGTPGVVTFSGVNGVPERAFATDLNNFGPRLGFAYRLPGRHETALRGGAGFFYGPTVSNTIGDVASLGFSTSASYSVAHAASQIAFPLQDGFPAYTRPELTAAFGAVAPGQTPNTAVAFFNPKQVAPISYQFNVGIQREVASDILLEIGYIGNVSHHLTGNDLSLNQAPAPLVPRPFPQFSNVTWINPSIGNSTYHGGFIRAEKRFNKGLSFLAHYTFSKFLDDMESSSEYGATGSYMDAYNRRLDKGRSGSDAPHHAVVTLLYSLRGWKLGLLETAESGPAFTVTSALNTTSVFPAGALRPNLLTEPSLPANERTIARWFDTAAFSQPAAFQFGNSPRSGLRGAPVVTTDATIERSFPFTEHIKFELRAEFYNLLNHAIFNIPGASFGTADFGVVSSARSSRTVQLAARISF